MKEITSGHVSLVFLQLLAVAITNISCCNGSTYVGCIPSEREALLRIKQDLVDSTNRLSSWVGDGDCCQWAAVVCNNLTGHVVELHLENNVIDTVSDAGFSTFSSGLSGKINPSLSDLQHLVYLDLTQNSIEGVIPHQLGSILGLQYLSLSGNFMLYADSLSWLSSLSSLKYLYLTGVDLSKASDWLLEINKLSSLRELQLAGSNLYHIPPLPLANFSSSLTHLDLSLNEFDNLLIPSWVFGLTNLESLHLGDNTFQGPIPKTFLNLTSLQHLDLADNMFNSSIPNWLSRLRNLQFLDFTFNSNLQGPIPRSWERLCNLKTVSLLGIKLNQDINEIFQIFSGGLEVLVLSTCQLYGQFTNNQTGQAKNLDVLDVSHNSTFGHVPSFLAKFPSLRFLDVSYNNLTGTLSEIDFVNLTKLRYFAVSGNSITVKFNQDWIPPFQLSYLCLRSCHLGPQFPLWIRSQKSLNFLDISSAGIVDSIPSWFWKSFSQVSYINISHNHIQGEIPDLTCAVDLHKLDVNSNNFSGSLPLISPHVSILILSNNAFSGSISKFLCHKMNEIRETKILRLGHNSLSGKLSDCWMNWKSLYVLELRFNKFTGSLPFSIGNLSVLEFLQLRHNNFSGVIPSSFKNCAKLVTLDISENKFSGFLPTWMGNSFSELVILNLRSNKFHGPLPTEFCHLSFIQILDLAHNNFSGSIPQCISNFSAMVVLNYSKGNELQFDSNFSYGFIEDATVVMKGQIAIYSTTLNLVRSIDLSENNFSGEIPIEVTKLHAVRSLNLSHNSLTGWIPETIGDMREMESLDLSANWLFGKIPQSIASLTFLSVLNLSDNRLSGRIPLGTQLQGFNASSFTGNELCGSPLKNCTVATVLPPSHDQETGGQEVNWLYVGMALAFAVGFWSSFASFLINQKWREMYWCFVDGLIDKFLPAP